MNTLLLVGAILGGGYMMLKQPEAGQPQPQPQQYPPLDAHIDQETLAITWHMYQGCQNPFQLRDAATRLKAAGFPRAASLLETKAAHLAPQQMPQGPQAAQAPAQAAQAQQAPASNGIAASVPKDVVEVQQLRAAIDRMTPEQRELFNRIPPDAPVVQVRVPPSVPPPAAGAPQESHFAEVVAEEHSLPLRANSIPTPNSGGITVKEKTKSL